MEIDDSLTNTGTVEVAGSGAHLGLGGASTNGGTIEAVSGASLSITAPLSNSKTVEAANSGTVVVQNTLNNASTGVVLATGQAAQMTLFHATISGGTAEALDSGTLVVDGETIAPDATVETLAGGTAIMSDTVIDRGTIVANAAGSLVEIAGGAIVSSGFVQVGNGIVDVLSGGTANIGFTSSGIGGLEIADASGRATVFTGTISGFGGSGHSNHKQHIDLVNVHSAPGAITLSYTSSGGNTSGTLFVSSGGQEVAAINFIGSYSSANFHVTSGAGGTVEITDPTVPNGGSAEPGAAGGLPPQGIDLPNIAFGAHTTLAYAQNSADTGDMLTVTDGRHAASFALLGNYMAASFVATADDRGGGTLVTNIGQTEEPPVLAHPHG